MDDNLFNYITCTINNNRLNGLNMCNIRLRIKVMKSDQVMMCLSLVAFDAYIANVR